jgi:hypothetical protein
MTVSPRHPAPSLVFLARGVERKGTRGRWEREACMRLKRWTLRRDELGRGSGLRLEVGRMEVARELMTKGGWRFVRSNAFL